MLMLSLARLRAYIAPAVLLHTPPRIPFAPG